MIIERIVYVLVCLILFGYIVNKYLKSKSSMYLSMLAIQLVCMITQLIAFFTKIYVDIFMQLYILVFNIILPSAIFMADYMNINFEEFIDIKLGDFYSRRNKYDKAIEKYKNAITKNNNNAQTFAKLGRLYNAKGDRRTAFDRFARAIEIDRNDYRSYYEIGVIFNDMGKQADAQIVLDNSLRIKPDFTPASELLAVVLCAQNKYDEAINVYKNATRYDPDNYQLYYQMGVVRTELRDFNDAKECYEKAIELNPSLYQAYFSLGQINLLKGELEHAESMFKKSLVSKDLTAKSYYQLAKVYILNDEEIKAVTYLGYAIDIDSSYKYKAESEPLFAKIKDYITGLSLANEVMQQAEVNENLKKEKTPTELEEVLEQEKAVERNTKKESFFMKDFLIHKDEEEKIEEIEEEVQESVEDVEEVSVAEDEEEKLDIFEKFKRLKKAEDEKAERLRREQKLRKLEELNIANNNEGVEELNSKNIVSEDEYYDEESMPIVRTVGSNDSEEARREIQKLEELKKSRNFEFEKKEKFVEKTFESDTENYINEIKKPIEEDTTNQNFEDEDTMDEPHFDFMDRFKRR